MKVVAQTGTDVVTVRYNTKLDQLLGIETAPFRWVVTDVKRQCRLGADMVEGHECDIRWIVKTQVCSVNHVGVCSAVHCLVGFDVKRAAEASLSIGYEEACCQLCASVMDCLKQKLVFRSRSAQTFFYR